MAKVRKGWMPVSGDYLAQLEAGEGGRRTLRPKRRWCGWEDDTVWGPDDGTDYVFRALESRARTANRLAAKAKKAHPDWVDPKASA